MTDNVSKALQCLGVLEMDAKGQNRNIHDILSEVDQKLKMIDDKDQLNEIIKLLLG